MPAVNFDRMYQAMVHDAKAGEGSNKVVYWSRPSTWKNQTLTPRQELEAAGHREVELKLTSTQENCDDPPQA